MAELSDEEKIRVREEYEARIAARRLAELDVVWGQAEANGVVDETPLYLDFCLFSLEENSARALADELQESYAVAVEWDASVDAWLIDGTTRPVPMAFGKKVLAEWVEYMVEFGFNNNSVLTSFGLARENSSSVEWSTETVEVEER